MTQTLTSIGLILILMYGWIRTRSFFTPTAVLCITWIVFLMGQAILAPDMIYSFKEGLLVLSLIGFFPIGEHIQLRPVRSAPVGEVDRLAFDSAMSDEGFRRKMLWTILVIGAFSLLPAPWAIAG